MAEHALFAGQRAGRSADGPGPSAPPSSHRARATGDPASSDPRLDDLFSDHGRRALVVSDSLLVANRCAGSAWAVTPPRFHFADRLSGAVTPSRAYGNAGATPQGDVTPQGAGRLECGIRRDRASAPSMRRSAVSGSVDRPGIRALAVPRSGDPDSGLSLSLKAASGTVTLTGDSPRSITHTGTRERW